MSVEQGGPGGRPCAVTSIQRLPQFREAAPSERNKHCDSFWWGLER